MSQNGVVEQVDQIIGAAKAKARNRKNPEKVSKPEIAKPGTMSIAIAAIKTQEATFTIRGISQLVSHAWGEKAVRQLLDKHMRGEGEADEAGNVTAPPKTPREKKDPKANFEGAKYKTRKGHDAIPATAIKAALISARKFTGLKIAEDVISGCIHVHGDADELIPIKYGKCTMREDMVRVGKWPNQVPDVRHRPGYDDWSAEIRITYRADKLSLSSLAALLQNAGFSVGIGERRPEKGGSWGMFSVTA